MYVQRLILLSAWGRGRKAMYLGKLVCLKSLMLHLDCTVTFFFFFLKEKSVKFRDVCVHAFYSLMLFQSENMC